MKVDVIIQSFKKPELLFYTLLSLKKHSEQHIHTIWINDDSDNDSVMDFYKSEIFQKALEPWVIMTRKNTQRGGWWFTPVKGLYPREGANKQVISSQADSLIKISRIWADFFPANTSNQPI